VCWNTEKQDRLESEVLSAARFIRNLIYGQLKNSRHTRNGPTFIEFFTYEQRQNKIVDGQLCFPDEISQSGGTPQAARAMHQSSHTVTLRVAKVGRKRGKPLAEDDLRPIGRMGQMLDAL
jgi:ABC-type thiamine transport system substrate-binding protein